MSSETEKAEEGFTGVFSRAACAYDRIGPRRFSYFGERLVEHAQLTSGATVLDVATGRGAVLVPAARRVGPQGHVVGIDISSDMVQVAADELKEAGLQNAEIRQMDAAHLQFSDAAFDWVLCGFGIMFFPDPDGALQGFGRVLKSRGCIGLTTWAEDTPVQNLFRQVLRRHLPLQSSQAGRSMGMQRFDTTEKLELALRKAGFEPTRLFTEDRDFIYSGEEELWAAMWASGIRKQLEPLASQELEQVRADVFQQFQTLKQADGIHGGFRAIFAFGGKTGH